MTEPVTSTNAARQSTTTGDPRDTRDRAEAARHREQVNARLRGEKP